MNKTQRKQMAYFRSVLEPLCDEPIEAVGYLFARGTILHGGLKGIVGGAGLPIPSELPDAVSDRVRDAQIKRAGGQLQMLCAITTTSLVLVGVAPTDTGLAADFWNLVVLSDPIVLRRDAIDVTHRRRVFSRVISITDRTDGSRYEFELHVFGTGDFNKPFVAALS